MSVQRADQAPPAAGRRQGPMLAVLLTAMFMAQFDFFVVNVAAPSLARDLRAGPAALELIVGGYAFSYASGMITGGRLGDLFGYRRLFVLGMLGFALASLLCGISANPPELVLARLVQGFTASLMVPQVLAVITASVPASARPRAIGWYGAASGLGSIAGQVLGGALLAANVFGLGWRVIFLVNVPIGVVASLLAARLLPLLRPGRRARLDLLGAGGIALSLALALVPLTLGHSAGWPAWAWICLALAVPAALLTGHRLRALAARGGMPVLDPDLLRVPSYLAGLGANIAFMAYFGSFMFTLTLLLQGGLGLTALDAGLVFAPMGALFTTTALLGHALVARYGLRVVAFGGGLTALGLLLLALHLHPGMGLPWVVGSLALVGAGNGLVLPQLIGAALRRIQPARAGTGSAMLSTAQQFAGAAGVALIGGVFFTVLGPAQPPGGYPGAMRVAALIDIGLVAAVIVAIGFHQRADRSQVRSRAGDGEGKESVRE
ncbi:MAG TPA: MFS transporter [Pseudonocardiaceae bacterium]|nr:MFS transporter [Pseudonocardiaceae bacterium]